MKAGRIGYEAYANATGGKTYDGREMPKWYELPARIRRAWQMAACEILIRGENHILEDEDYENTGENRSEATEEP